MISLTIRLDPKQNLELRWVPPTQDVSDRHQHLGFLWNIFFVSFRQVTWVPIPNLKPPPCSLFTMASSGEVHHPLRQNLSPKHGNNNWLVTSELAGLLFSGLCSPLVSLKRPNLTNPCFWVHYVRGPVMMKTATQTSTVSPRDFEQKFETIRASPPFHSEALHSRKLRWTLKRMRCMEEEFPASICPDFWCAAVRFRGVASLKGFAKKD